MITSEQLLFILNGKKEDEKFIKFQERIINTKLKVIGVKIPALRKFAKESYKNKIEIEFNKETDKYFECVVLEGFLIGFEKSKGVVRQKLKKYFKKMDNWAVVDMVCSSLTCFKKEPGNDVFSFFQDLVKSENLFTVRFGIVGLLKFFSGAEHNKKVLEVLSSVKCGEYYVDMAIAWLISEIIVKNVQNAENIMKKVKLINNFNSFIVNKSVDKVKDSFRIDKKTKEKLKEYKVKC